jgi:hypothetical protein
VAPGRADRVGIAASSLCALHCALGAALAGTAAAGGLLLEESVELVLVAAAVIVAAVAIGLGFREHRQSAPAWIAGAGIVLLAAARAGPESAEAALSIAGAAVLIAAHLANLRYLRRAGVC